MCASVMARGVRFVVGLGLGWGKGGVYARWLRGSAEGRGEVSVSQLQIGHVRR